MADFCETLAETAVVAEACDQAGMGISGAYAARRRNPVFAAAWDAALTIARERLADTRTPEEIAILEADAAADRTTARAEDEQLRDAWFEYLRAQGGAGNDPASERSELFVAEDRPEDTARRRADAAV